MRTVVIATLPLLGLAACATTSQTTPEELAYCRQMERSMGTQTTHDHTEMKGAGPNPMNVTHERCQRILRDSD
ncbi:MAG: hypothetical protein ACXWUN_10580 [Allosphingosinicella sp.]